MSDNKVLDMMRELLVDKLMNHPRKSYTVLHPSDSEYTAVLPLEDIVEVLMGVCSELLREAEEERKDPVGCDCDDDCNNKCDDCKKDDNKPGYINNWDTLSYYDKDREGTLEMIDILDEEEII